MHIHSETEVINPKKNRLKSNIIHLAVALLAVLVFPWLLSLFSGPKIQEIRQSNPQYNNNSRLEYYKGRVNKVTGEIVPQNSQDLVLIQQLDVKPLEGPDKGEIFGLETQVNKLAEVSKFKEGDTVILVKVNEEGQGRYFISERYRLDQVNLSIMFFVLLVLILVGFRGVTALAGLVFSVLALTNFLIPMILIGQNVVLITFLTGLFIMTVSLYLSHGFNKTISVSLLASAITITLSTLFSIAVVYFTKLTGTGSEDAYQLQFTNATIGVNFQGLFLSAMIIGTLGVLDDITTSQAFTVSEISRANPKLSSKELYRRGLIVGKEHIISLVNTLGLAYVSVALPVLMYYIIYNPQPLWVSFNSENIVEEIIRTIVGSSALLLAVPITTFLAARFLKHNTTQEDHSGHNHEFATKVVTKKPQPNFVEKFKNIFKNKKPSKSKELVIFDKNLETKKAIKKPETKPASSPKVVKSEAVKKAEVAQKLVPEPKVVEKSVEKVAEYDFEELPTKVDFSGKNNQKDTNNKKRIQL